MILNKKAKPSNINYSTLSNMSSVLVIYKWMPIPSVIPPALLRFVLGSVLVGLYAMRDKSEGFFILKFLIMLSF